MENEEAGTIVRPSGSAIQNFLYKKDECTGTEKDSEEWYWLEQYQQNRTWDLFIQSISVLVLILNVSSEPWHYVTVVY